MDRREVISIVQDFLQEERELPWVGRNYQGNQTSVIWQVDRNPFTGISSLEYGDQKSILLLQDAQGYPTADGEVIMRYPGLEVILAEEGCCWYSSSLIILPGGKYWARANSWLVSKGLKIAPFDMRQSSRSDRSEGPSEDRTLRHGINITTIVKK